MLAMINKKVVQKIIPLKETLRAQWSNGKPVLSPVFINEVYYIRSDLQE